MLYSDCWLKKGYKKSSRIRINDHIDLFKWYDDSKVNIGVTISFNFADDVHYELRTDQWSKFINLISKQKDISDYDSLNSFFEMDYPHIQLSDFLEKNNIEYKKIAFY